MPMTPEQEAQVLADNAEFKKQLAALAPVAGEVAGLKATLATKDSEIAELKKAVSPLSVNSATAALKTAYPDVPEASLMAVINLPAESQKAVLEPMQKTAAELKVKLTKTDPRSGWADAGSIEASTEAEGLARKAEREKAYWEHAKDGNVFGMLDERASEIAAHVRRAFAR